MKVKLLVLLLICLIGVTSCWKGPYTDIRDVPFRGQEMNDWCGIACIQMWAAHDKKDPEPEQGEISDWVQSHATRPTIGGAAAEDVARGVGQFTNSSGHFLQTNLDNLGQDRCIAASLISIKDFRLSIMPFQYGAHAVLVVGYEWHYENSKRVADSMYYHDPLRGPSKIVTAADLKEFHFKFDATLYYNTYWVIVGRQKNELDGWDAYMTFIAEGGTFYGGPKVYNPVNWDPSTPH